MCLASLALALLCPAVAFVVFLMRRVTGDVGGPWEGIQAGSRERGSGMAHTQSEQGLHHVLR